jgi:hypothetical protein
LVLKTSPGGLKSGDSFHLSAILAEHAREIARQVQHVLAVEFEQSAVV